MKITAIRATPVNIPLETPYYWSPGLYPGTSKVVVEVETEEERRRRALARMAARKWTRPEGYRFDRDEANER
mgnify:CR=1 FL=1